MPYMSASIQFLVSAPSHAPIPPLKFISPTSSLYTSGGDSSRLPSAGSDSSISSPGPHITPVSSLSRSSWRNFPHSLGAKLPSIPSSQCSSVSDSGFVAHGIGFNCLHTSVRLMQDCRLNLIHIPLPLYPLFVQAILSIVLPESSGKGDSSGDDSGSLHSISDGSVASNFINISITSIECSVVCSGEAADKFFRPIIRSLAPELRESVSISEDDFVAIQVDGEGLDAGQRVLDLTSPLALAGVPIFFITTYFSDYILVPAKNRKHVTKALQRRGFVFEKYTESFVTTSSHHRHSSSTSSFGGAPLTPPPTTTLSDLEVRTFNTLRKQNVVPQVDPSIKLVLCAGSRSSRKSGDGGDGGLKFGLIRCLISQPQFISVTMTDMEPPSLLLEKDRLSMFDTDVEILLGSKEDVLIPIVLDFRDLPADLTGIVCGVAGRLVGGTKGGILDGGVPVEMSYLSTARAGAVMVAEDDISRAVAALNL